MAHKIPRAAHGVSTVERIKRKFAATSHYRCHGWDTDASNDSRPLPEYTSKDRPGPDHLRYVLNMQREARERQAATSHMHGR